MGVLLDERRERGILTFYKNKVVTLISARAVEYSVERRIDFLKLVHDLCPAGERNSLAVRALG